MAHDATATTTVEAGSREPTLSVILPNYNHSQFIARAISALAEQDWPPTEIIVIDDASTDHSREVVEALAARYPKVWLIANANNKGVAFRSQQGLEAARGQYVYFAASDDLVLPGFFNLALDSFRRFPEAGLFCGETIIVDGESSRVIGRRPAVRPRFTLGWITPEQTRRLLSSSDNWIVTGSAVLKRSAVLEAGGFDPRLGSFADGFMVRKIALTDGFCFAPKAVSVWRIFSEGVSRSVALEEENARQFLIRIPKYIEKDPVFPAWYADKFRDRWRFATARLALQSTPIGYAVLLSMGTRSSLDTAVITLMTRSPFPLPLMKLSALLWLMIRLSPTSVYRLAITSFLRTFERRTWKSEALSAYTARLDRGNAT